ncbi:MAG: hypothetical protein WBO73_01375 [Gammaproteobacteria bacterium]|jgi:hypothetical protein
MYQKLAFTALALVVSGVTVAGDLYKDLDINQDTKISPEEAAALPQLKNQWSALDVNADGMLDRAEFAKMETMEVKEMKGAVPKY